LVVVFREGLSQPEFHLGKALAANHSYIWSVRVREGRRNISNWATYSYQIVSPVPGAVFGSDPVCRSFLKLPQFESSRSLWVKT
jgi:hypothetical protein